MHRGEIFLDIDEKSLVFFKISVNILKLLCSSICSSLITEKSAAQSPERGRAVFFWLNTGATSRFIFSYTGIINKAVPKVNREQ